MNGLHIYKYFKRFFDILLSGLAILILSPLLLLIYLLVVLKLGTPGIYVTERIGKGNKGFLLYKFRSMTDSRDSQGKLLPDTERLTKFGRILRAASLDELPELFNIFKGDMSLIGPRPLPPIYLPYYTDEEIKRHEIRPGLSGWAQVNGRNSISWEKKFEYDLEYLNNYSFAMDLKILFLTVKKVFVHEGIGQGEQHPGSLHELREKNPNYGKQTGEEK